MKWYLKCLSNYANFKGRARRKEYWYFLLFNMIFAYVFLGLDNLFGTTFGFYDGLYDQIDYYGQAEMYSVGPAYGWLYMMYTVAVLVPGLAVAWRRLQDIGKSGWLIFVPVYGFILCFRNSEEGENQHGPNPKTEEIVD